MTVLALAAAIWFGIHAFVAGSPLRARLVGALGEVKYRGLFSLMSVAALALLIWAYKGAPVVALWSGAPFKALAQWVMPIAFILFICGVTTPNPSSAGQERLLDKADAAVGIQKITRHPFLWSVALWSLVHVLARGELAGLLFFGSLGATALVGTAQIDAKNRARNAEGFARYAAVTSNLPLAALVQGRARVGLGEIGWWRILAALAAWAAAYHFHAAVFGVSAA